MKINSGLVIVVVCVAFIFTIGCTGETAPAGSPSLSETPVPAPDTTPGSTTLNAVYIYGNGCGACEKVNPLIAEIQVRYPELHVEMLEVNENKQNFEKFKTLRQSGFNNTKWAIPTIYIGKNALVGQPEITDHFEEYILAEKQRIAAGDSPK